LGAAARHRLVAQRGDKGLIDARDAREDGDAAAAEACGDAWLGTLGTYGMDVDASITDVVGTFVLGV